MPGSQGGARGSAAGGLGEVEAPGDDGGRVAGVLQSAEGDGLVEYCGGVVAVGCDQHQLGSQGRPGVRPGEPVGAAGSLDARLDGVGEAVFARAKLMAST